MKQIRKKKNFSFSALISKVGINPCVSVATTITNQLKALKGYLQVKGVINNYPFRQTLVPERNGEHPLYVNGQC